MLIGASAGADTHCPIRVAATQHAKTPRWGSARDAVTREDFEQRFSQVLSLQTRRRGAPERKGQPRFQFVCFEAASVNLKVSEGERYTP